jgi:antitoxin PrlF
VRAKAQLTLPDDIRRALHIGEGDEVEFSLHDDGTVTVRGFVSIPTDQAWFFAPEWLAGEQEADNEIAAGRGTVHESADSMFAHAARALRHDSATPHCQRRLSRSGGQRRRAWHAARDLRRMRAAPPKAELAALPGRLPGNGSAGDGSATMAQSTGRWREGTRPFGLMFLIFLKIKTSFSRTDRGSTLKDRLTVDPGRPTTARGRVPAARPVRRSRLG